MNEILDALGTSLILLFIPWVVVQIGGSVALAVRYGVPKWIGVAGGCIPIPFVGWLVVLGVGMRRGGGDDSDDFGTGDGDITHGQRVEW